MTDIYLSDTEVALQDDAGALWRDAAGSTSQAIAALASRLESTAPRRVRVWLGAALCRPVFLAPLAGGLSRRERLHVMEQDAIARSGLAPPCRVSIDVADPAGGVLAVVVQDDFLSAIDRALADRGLRAFSIQPWWAHVLDEALRARPALRALGVSEGTAMTILTGDGRQFSGAHAVCPVESAEAGAAAFARSLIAGMIPDVDALAVRLDWSSATPGARRRAFPDSDLTFGAWTVSDEGAS